MNSTPIVIVGAGYMAKEYAKVLKAQNRNFIVVGRGEESARKFTEETGVEVITGGIEKYIDEYQNDHPTTGIVAVRSLMLKETAELMIQNGFKRLLVEKPGAVSSAGIKELKQTADQYGTQVVIAYNRRYFASVLEAEKRIAEDGGVTSFTFEFTEWASTLLKAVPDKEELRFVFYGNSAHVVDMAFHLGGKPKEMSCYTTGKGLLEWHPLAATFAGAGISEKGASFTYQANYDAPGRWGVEVLTKKHRYIFRPLEKLQIQDIGSVKVEFVDIDDHIDTEYKPGVYREVEEFLDKDIKDTQLCSLDEQVRDFEILDQMAEVV